MITWQRYLYISLQSSAGVLRTTLQAGWCDGTGRVGSGSRGARCTRLQGRGRSVPWLPSVLQQQRLLLGERLQPDQGMASTVVANESVPKIIINDAIKFCC